MNLRDLEYVIAVADLRNFSNAADHCAVSQPTLSAQIKKLEESLGVKLFERSNKSVMPTEVGSTVVQAARRIMLETDRIRDAAAAAHDPMAGRFRLGAFPTLGAYLFPELIPQIKSTLPSLNLILLEEKSEQLIEKLRQGSLDAAFLALPLDDKNMVEEPLFNDPFFLAVSAENALASKKTIDQDALRKHKLLLLEEGHCLRDQALEVCELMGVGDDTDFRATSLETLRQMVRAGTGITLMPKIACDFGDEFVTYIPFSDHPPFRTIGLVRRKTSSRTAVFKELARLVRQSIPNVLD